MKQTNTMKTIRTLLILSLLYFCSASIAQAQFYLGGTKNTNVGGTGFYFINGGSVSSSTWSVVPNTATISPQGNSQASIQFNAPGVYAVRATVNGSIQTSEYSVVVSYPPPANPANPIVSSTSCGQAILARSGTPPSGVRWYWQGKNATTSSFKTNLGYGANYTANQGTGTYYIRARNTATGAWSSALGSVSVTINTSTATPNASADAGTVCSGNSTFMTASGVSGATYRWYNASNTFIGTGATIGTGNLTSVTTFRVSATVNGCESAKRNVTVNVSASPSVYSLSNNGPSEVCASSTIGSVRLSDSQSGVTYQLYRNNSISGATKSGSGSALTWSNLGAGTYKVIAKNTNNTCNNVNMTGQVTIGTLTPSTVGISSGAGTTGICPGTSVTLISQGLSEQEWSTGQLNSTSITVTPNAGTTTQYTVTGFDECGEERTASISLTVNGNINQPNVSNNNPICVGSSTTLTASGISGATYKWYNASNGFITNGSSFTTPNLNGNTTYRVAATVNGCEGPKRTVVVQVTGAPQVFNLENSGAAQVCVGNTNGGVRLLDSQTGVDYRLVKNNTPTSNVKTGSGSALIWNNLGPGTYKVTASNTGGTCGTITMQNEIVIATANSGSVSISYSVPDKDNICPGETVQLFATGVNIASNSNFTWSNGTVGTSTTVNLNAGNNLTLTVDATDLCGDTQTASISLRAQQNMGNVSISGPDTRCEGAGSYNYDASISNESQLGNLTYAWSINPSNAAQSFNQSTGLVQWSPTFSGNATITVTADNGCESKSTSITVSTAQQIAFFEDKDRDGFYIDQITSCSNPNPTIYVTANQVEGPNDCDDDNAAIHPNTIWLLNVDNDGHAAIGASVTGCTPPNNNYTDYQYETLPEDDCDDSDPLIGGPKNWYLDNDGDGYPATSTPELSCTQPSDKHFFGPFIAVDCDDDDAQITSIVWYEDLDGDGLGGEPGGRKTRACTRPNDGVNWVDNQDDYCPGDINNTCASYPCSSTFEDDTLSGENYIYARTFQTEQTTTPNYFEENDELIQEITYFDGLGRAIQQIGIDQSPNKNDIVMHMEYDGLGRMQKEWLPYATADGTLAVLRSSAKTAIENYYNTPKYENTLNPFSEKEFEASPLSRVYKQAAPGNDWALGANHEVGFEYNTNSAADAVVQFEVSINEVSTNEVHTFNPSLTQNGTYATGELVKNITYDENHTSGKNHSTEEFTDKEGRVVLKRTYADYDGSTEVAHDSYYIYDDYGNLSYVLPPKVDVTDGVSQDELDDLAYQYTYDERNRLVIKKIPGKGEEYIIYNSLDQPVMTQDANQRAKSPKEWLFTMYDPFGRLAFTGIAKNNETREQAQNAVNTIIPSAGRNPWVTQTSTPNTIGGASVYYSNDSYPKSTIDEVLTINYYDTYVDRPVGAPTSVQLLGSTTNETNTTAVRGLSTVTKIKVLDVSGTNVWINSATYYDEKARPIYTYSKNNYLGTTDIVSSQLDFTGRVLKSRTSHLRAGNTIVTIDNFTYDHVGRLLSQTQCIGDETMGNACEEGGSGNGVDNSLNLDGDITSNRVAKISIDVTPIATLLPGTILRIDPNATGNSGPGGEELIVFNKYDELGQLEAKKVGGTPGNSYANTSGLQTVDYSYNVRGWLTGINDLDDTDQTLTTAANKLFAFRIGYNEGANPLYNGNIANTQWKTLSDDTNLKQYNYSYDALNRITAATGGAGFSNYNVSGIAYDKMGNIATLIRQGHTNSAATTFGVMDNLVYEYDNGNQLQKVTDNANDGFGFKEASNTANEYGYDENGNMISDENKVITAIEYNYLNLPVSMDIDGGTIGYVYDATGTKLKKTVISGGNTEYCNGYIYENGQLQFFSHPEGYVNANGSGYDFVYQYTDHLGNVRLSYTDDPSNSGTPTIIEENNYYPFGLKHKGYNSGGDTALANDTAQKWKYANEEYEEELGKNTVAYQWRDYDPAIGRFNKVDRFAEKYVSHSPYAFTKNNPILYREIAGDSIVDSDNIVRDFRNVINSKIGELDRLLNDENFNFTQAGVTRSQLTQLRGDLNGIIGELDALESSDQIYRVSFDSNFGTDEGGVSFDNSDNSVAIQVGEGTGNGVIGQELLHGYQFQTGEISISYDNSAYGSLYDIGDETATYRREHTLELGIRGLSTRNNVTNASTRARGASLSPPLYVGLPERSINLSSPEGASLRLNNQAIRNVNSSSTAAGLAPAARTTEVFIGWNKD